MLSKEDNATLTRVGPGTLMGNLLRRYWTPALLSVEVPEPTAPYPTDYAVSADGQRFLVNTVVDQPTRPALTVILNWTAALNK